jgi:peptide/nickel transport system substrate-binding protein
MGMTPAKRVGPALCVGLALSLALAACGGDNKKETGGGTGGGGNAVKGGTVTVYHENDIEHLDPQRNYVTDSGTIGKLVTRTLTVFKWNAEKNTAELKPDLAKSWESSDDLKTWTFHLKDGLKYEDGTAVTAKDIKYGAERSFSPDLAEGAPYVHEYTDCKGYKGPYVGGNNGGKGCTGIEAPDDKTIIFKLNQPVAEFASTASLFPYSPVPQAKDTKTQYDNHPIATGPYKVESYARNKQLVLVRNTNWDPATDEARAALPDKFIFKFGDDPATVDQRLIANGTADQNSVSMDGIQPENVAKTSSAAVKPRVVQSGDWCRRYIAFNQQHALLKNQKLREALYVGLDLTSYRDGRGGELLSKEIDSIVPETLDGYQPEATFKVPPAGDQVKAKQLLQESGYKGEKLVLGSSDTGLAVKAAEAAQASWKAIGVNVEIKKIPGSNYYSTQQNDASATDLVTAGWCFDWPSMSSIVAPVLGEDSTQPGKAAQNNYGRQTLDFDKMKQIGLEKDLKKATQDWSNVYAEVMATAPLVPTVKDLNVYVTGGNIDNAHPDQYFGGIFDLTSISLKKVG